jgi:ABC-2 type transport system ATP-binding protein
MINVTNLSRSYGKFMAVDDISFSISQGEIVGLLGHNGAGKTTIMKMLTGYLEPTSGTILIDGLNIDTNRQKIQRKIGYLPENCPVYLEMSILEYLEYGATLQGVPEQDRANRICEAIDRTALYEKANQRIATLSRGYRQRTGVAQAILHKPSILILDEPTNGLDPTQINQMRNLITELAETSTVIVSTHILQEVQAICDRVLIIKDGRLALDSRMNELQKNTKLLVSTDAEEAKAVPMFTSLANIDSASARTTKQQGGIQNSFELLLSSDSDSQETTAQVAKSIHDSGWKLYGMHFEARNLETVFAEISS